MKKLLGILILAAGCAGGGSAPPPGKQAPQKDEELDKLLKQENAAERKKGSQAQTSDESYSRIELPALLGAYEKDEIEADREYRSKLVEVRGTVESIEGSVVVLSAAGAKLRCRCTFPGGFGDGVTMNSGMEVRVRGRVQGRQGDVLLEDCRIRP